jgi:hypothetical protein
MLASLGADSELRAALVSLLFFLSLPSSQAFVAAIARVA